MKPAYDYNNSRYEFIDAGWDELDAHTLAIEAMSPQAMSPPYKKILDDSDDVSELAWQARRFQD